MNNDSFAMGSNQMTPQQFSSNMSSSSYHKNMQEMVVDQKSMSAEPNSEHGSGMKP